MRHNRRLELDRFWESLLDMIQSISHLCSQAP